METKYSRKSDNYKALSDLYAARHWISDCMTAVNYVTVWDRKIPTHALRKSKKLETMRTNLLEWIDLEIEDLEKDIK